MWNWDSVNYADQIVDLIIAVVQSALILVLTTLLTRYLFNRILLREKVIGKRLSEYGIERVKSNDAGILSEKDHQYLFALNGHQVPREADFMFLTGSSFFRDFQKKTGYIESLAKRGCKVKVLLANPERGRFGVEEVELSAEKIEEMAQYYYNVIIGKEKTKSFLERSYVMLIKSKVMPADGDFASEETILNIKNLLKKNGDHNCQVRQARQWLKEINERNKECPAAVQVELHYYEDEYQMPMMIARFNADERAAKSSRNKPTVYAPRTMGKDKNQNRIMVWTNLNAPIRETMESISVFCYKNEDRDAAFVNDVCSSFDYLIDTYPENMAA